MSHAGMGDSGLVAHYDGGYWQLLSTGTLAPVLDLWGAVDSRTGPQEVLALASHSLGLPSEKKLLSISGTAVTAMPDSGLLPMLTGVWFASPGSEHYIVGASLYRKANPSSSLPWLDFRGNLTQYYTFGIRGNAANDLMIVESYGEVIHYNGSSWKSFKEVTALSTGNLCAVAMKGNLAIAVGSNEGRAAVLVGRR